MSLTFNAKTFNEDSSGPTAYSYAGPAHTLSTKDYLVLKRTAPKPTSVFSGVGRTSAKLTRTATLTGAATPTGEAIIEVSVSAPVGMAAADVDAMLNDMGALVSGADMKTHVKQQKISY